MTKGTPALRDRITAVHEAGHAYVGYMMRALCGEITGCTIQPKNVDGVILNGHCTLAATPLIAARERPADWSDEQWHTVVSLDDFRVNIYLAGFMAEAIYADKSAAAGQWTPVEETQVEDRKELARDLQKEDSQQLPSDLRVARKILLYAWKESEIEDRLHQLNVDTALLLLDGWPAVEAVASALVEKRTLSGEEVGTIIENALHRLAAEKSLALPSASVVT